MGDLEPITRNEKLWSGEDLTPVTRREMYIKHLYDETQVIPEYPVTREEMFILKAGEELHDVTIEQLTATENKTYSEKGVAYSPVIVNVPQTTLTTLDVTENGTYTAPSGTAYSEVDVDVPLPENAYLLKEIEDVEIASFTDGSDLPMPKLEVGIEPVQEGSGDPSPENIRPIIGWDEVNVTRCGKNIATTEIYKNNYVLASDGTENYASGFIITKLIKIDSSNSCYLSMIGEQSSSSDAIRVGFYDEFLNFISRLERSTPTPITIPNNAEYIRLSYRNIGPYFKDIQLEIGDDATAYEPYNGQTITLDLDGTRYGGKVDLVSGVMTVDRAYLTIDDFNSSGGSGTSAGGLHWFDVTNKPKGESGNKNICSICGYIQNGWTSTITVMSVAISETIPVRIYDSSESLSDFKDKYPNLQVVYELATPLTIQLTPTVVKSLRGVNNVWADCGNILDLSYLAKEE